VRDEEMLEKSASGDRVDLILYKREGGEKGEGSKGSPADREPSTGETGWAQQL